MKTNQLIKLGLLFIFSLFLFGLSVKAQTIEFSPNGQTLAVNWVIDVAVGDDFSQYLFYDVKSGKLLSSLNAFDQAGDLIFAKDSKTLILAERLNFQKIALNDKGNLMMLDNPNSVENLAIDNANQRKVNSDFIGLALSEDGKTIYKVYPNFFNAYTYPELKHIPELAREYELKENEFDQTELVGISRNGKFIVEQEFKGTQTALIVKEINGQNSFRLEGLPMTKSNAFPRISAIISSNNETLMLKSIDDSLDLQLTFWDLRSRQKIWTFSSKLLDEKDAQNYYSLGAAVLSPDGKKVAAKFSAIDKNSEMVSVIAIYNLQTKETIEIKEKIVDGVRFGEALAFSPDSQSLVTVSTSFLPASLSLRVELWNAGNGTKIKKFE